MFNLWFEQAKNFVYIEDVLQQLFSKSTEVNTSYY